MLTQNQNKRLKYAMQRVTSLFDLANLGSKYGIFSVAILLALTSCNRQNPFER